MSTPTSSPPTVGHARWWLSAILAVALALALIPPAAAAPDDGASLEPEAIHPDLLAAVETAATHGETIQALLVSRDQADVARLAGDRGAVVTALQRVAAASERQLETELALHGLDTEVRIVNWFWIQNMGLVEFEASPERVQALAGLRGVERVVPNFEVTLIEPERTEPELGTAIVDDRTWGVDRIEAHRVHGELGIVGSGVRVATLDTGVDITHPDLAGKLVTDDPADPAYPGGWMEFDGSGNLVSSNPHDSAYHGTHVAGTIHGGNASGVQVGVAPGADMMHGLVIPGGGGSFAQVAAGMQWAVAPTDAAGNPAGQPADVVNMSLGGNGFFDEMIAPTVNMRAAGTFPAFAIGNNCGAAGTASPGNVYDAVAVGATDIGDSIASFSCGGVVQRSSWGNPPDHWPTSYVKPDISAPGVNTWSTMPGGGYSYLSGTSMATPHTAGTVALMREAAPELGIDELFDQLAATAFFDDRHGPDRPNTRFGEGRINAFDATEPIAIDSGITGTVLDAATGDPIAGATVTNLTTGSSTTAGADGSYTVRAEPGTYDLQADAFGYEPTTVTGIEVVAETFTVQDLALEVSPAGTITGTVTFAESGTGVPGATITLVGTSLSTTTGPSGTYTFAEVPVGTYEVAVSAVGFPTPPTQTVTVEEGETATADFVLEAPPQLVGVMGDYNGTIADFLAEHGIASEPVGWSDDPTGYATLIVNRPGAPGEAAFQDFLAATDAAGTGLVMLDTWSTSGNGVWLLHSYLGNPAERGTGFSSTIPELYYEVTGEHPVLDGFEVGDHVTFDATTNFKDHAWFGGYEGDGREVIADAARSDTGVVGNGIGVQQRDNNRHVLLSMHAASLYVNPTQWHPDAAQVFLNAIDWVTPDRDEDYPLFVVSDLTVDPDVVLAGEPVDVGVTVTNVGTAAGEHAVTLRVDGAVEDTTTVTLAPGASTAVSWTVTRQELGTYTVSVAHLSDTFRVRAPVVELSVHTVDGPGMTPEPMAGATVELLHGDELLGVGTTDADGLLAFEAPAGDATYTVIARRAATDDHDHAYLLTRPHRVDDDTSIEMRPRTLGESEVSDGYAWNFSALVDLQVDAVAGSHEAWTYVRSGLTGPYGFAYAPGPLVTTVGDADGFEAVNVHAVTALERDWWYASEIITGLDWRDPVRYEHTFGGDATATLDASFTDGTEFAATWSVGDAYGHPFAAMLRTDLRPFADVPEVLELEDVVSTLRGEAPHAAEVILRLFAPGGEPVHAGGVSWDERTVVRDLADLVDEVVAGTYTLSVEIASGPYSGTVTADAELIAAVPTRTLSADTIALGDTFTAEITFVVTGPGTVSVTEAIAPAGQAEGEAIGNGWPVTAWEASADATYDGNGTWTFADGAVQPGDTVTLTYTAMSPLNITTPSTWALSGSVQLGDAVEAIAGDDELTVVAATGGDRPGNGNPGNGGGGGGNGGGDGDGGGPGNGRGGR
jgi:subtilisin family serine protease